MNSAYPLSWDKLFEKTQDSLRIGLFRIDRDGNLHEADAGLAQILRYPSLETLLNSNPTGIWVTLDERDNLLHLLASLSGVHLSRFSLRRFDGSIFEAEINAYAVRDDQEKILWYEGTIQDSPAQAAQERHISQIFQAISTAPRDSFFSVLAQELAGVLGADYVLVAEKIENEIQPLAIILPNQKTAKSVRFKIAGTPFERVFNDGSYTYLAETSQPSQQTGKLDPTTMEGFSGIRLVDSRKTPVGLIAAMYKKRPDNLMEAEALLLQFATPAAVELERWQALNRLEINERRFRALVENSATGLTVLDAEGKILYTSPSADHIFGVTSIDRVGMHFSEYIHPEDRQQTRLAFKTILENQGEKIPFLVRSYDHNHTWFWIEGNAINLLSEPSVQGIVLNYRDVTEQKTAMNRLQEGEKELLYRAGFERLILGISTRLINVRTEQMIDELENALGEIGNFTQVDRAHIFLFSLDLSTMYCIAEWNRAGISMPSLKELQKLPAQASSWWFSKINAHEVFYFNSKSEIPENERAGIQNSRWLDEKSTIDVPIVSAGRLVGFMGLSSVHEERQWTQDEIDLQKLLAEIIANALERRDAETRINRQLENQAALHKIEKAITSKSDIGSVMNLILEQATTQLGMDAAVILLYDPLAHGLYFGSGRGFKPGRATTALRYLQNPLLERVVKERQMLHLPIPRDWQDIWENEGFTVYFGVPLVAKGEVNGVLELYQRAAFEPTEDWLTFLYMLAEQAAIAIDNVSLFQNLQRSLRDLNQAYDTTLEGWARALELRHQETEGHSQRVINWVMRLAKMMGLDEDELVHMRRGALLHDVGKMGIPDAILDKTGPLGKEEWDIMKKHPEMARNMLAPIKFLEPALDIPYCHHEWWDGSGYPRGLKGEQIPLNARIFTVVDVWDALTQPRKYRPEWERQWSPKRAAEYLLDQAGKKFDPQVVRAFLLLLQSDGVKFYS